MNKEHLVLSEKMREAIMFATEYHANQEDKAGNLYISHPFRVAISVFPLGADYFIVGMLHDVVEDTVATLEVVKEKFGVTIADAVEAISRRNISTSFGPTSFGMSKIKEDDESYLARVKANLIAFEVKLADINDNLSPERIGRLSEKERQRLEHKYKKCLDILLGVNKSRN